MKEDSLNEILTNNNRQKNAANLRRLTDFELIDYYSKTILILFFN